MYSAHRVVIQVDNIISIVPSENYIAGGFSDFLVEQEDLLDEREDSLDDLEE